MMGVTDRRLHNSRVIGEPFSTPAEVVSWHGAMQAQDYGPAKWSIGQRGADLADSDLDATVATGEILRTHVLRPTWHFVVREDIRWLLALTGPRVQKQNGPRYRELALDARTLARCESLTASALRGGNQLTRTEIAAALEAGGIDNSGQRLPYILMHCELEAIICSGARAAKHHTYALLEERAPGHNRIDRDESLVELTRRYLQSHGPATIRDLRWWSSLTLTDIKKALELLGPEVVSRLIEGVTFWSIASESPPSRAGKVHLLPTYDELIVGYTESRFFGDARAPAARNVWSKRTLPTGVALFDGHILGHWKRTVVKDLVRVEVLTYRDLQSAEEHALTRAANDLGRFLGLPAGLEVDRI